MHHRTDPIGNHLPPRLHFDHGSYYYRVWVDGKARKQRLAKSYREALKLWAEIEGKDEPRNLSTTLRQ